MMLAPGVRLGAYEITAAIGAGGMGEVYRATDTRLGREVALKLLPEMFAADPERLARFDREARLLASLNHPNIAHLYGFETATPAAGGTVHLLAMELAEGEDLAERLKRGPLPADEALAIARQIADALEEAHEKGIVHRDLKPANVKLAPDGRVKVLDFGLAKAWTGETTGGSSPDLSHSPTLARPGTEAGLVLGTAAYMSPEQARGRPVDKRADIWAFGVVLHEMLTGARLFSGETVSDTLAEVLKGGIDFDVLPPDTPATVRRLLRQCLERNPKNRLHDIGDARLTLDDALAGSNDERPAAAATAPRAGWSLAALCAAAALAAGVAAGWLAGGRGGAGVAESRVSFERLTFRPGHFVNARFAPDGQTVFLSADWNRHDREIFQVRPKAGELSVGLAGVELLSVSRSGELAVLLPRIETGIPYRMTGTLAVVSASGGTPRKLAEDVVAADWAPDGRSLAVLRAEGSGWRVEYPLGTLLYETPRRVTWIRVSPRGDAVAIFEADATAQWSVVVIPRSGPREVWSSGWSDWWNLAWSPDGAEIWFGATLAGQAASLHAVDRNGALRTILNAPGTLEVHDVAPDRSMLVAQVEARTRTFGGTTAAQPRELSWLEDSNVADVSHDGSQVLLGVTSEREPDGEAIYLRSTDGAPAVRLGTGSPQELSPDGKWALALRGTAIVALPTAAGKERVRQTDLTALEEAHWMPDGTHVLVVGREPAGQRIASVVDLDGGPARVVVGRLDLRRAPSPGGLLSPVSPDGTVVAAAMASGGVVLLPLDGGEPRPLPGTGPNDIPIQWTPDARRLFVFDPSELPARVHVVDAASGRRELWREIEPIDREGVAGITSVVVTPDASAFAYSHRQFRSSLYLAKGVR